MVKIVAISGSLQKASCHSGIIRALINLHTEGVTIDFVDIHDVPLFNEDIERQGVPESVKVIADKVRAAEGLILAVPENNGSVSAPIKNIYDWLSRGGEKSSVYKKPVAFVSTGGYGGKSGQEAMKSIIQYCKLELMEEPKVQIRRYEPGNFGEDGSLINKKIIEETLIPFLHAYVQFLRNHHKI